VSTRARATRHNCDRLASGVSGGDITCLKSNDTLDGLWNGDDRSGDVGDGLGLGERPASGLGAAGTDFNGDRKGGRADLRKKECGLLGDVRLPFSGTEISIADISGIQLDSVDLLSLTRILDTVVDDEQTETLGDFSAVNCITWNKGASSACGLGRGNCNKLVENSAFQTSHTFI
jgi:hypothetical protein